MPFIKPKASKIKRKGSDKLKKAAEGEEKEYMGRSRQEKASG